MFRKKKFITKVQHQGVVADQFLTTSAALHWMYTNCTSWTLNFLSDKSLGFWSGISMGKQWGKCQIIQHCRISLCYCNRMTFFLLAWKSEATFSWETVKVKVFRSNEWSVHFRHMQDCHFESCAFQESVLKMAVLLPFPLFHWNSCFPSYHTCLNSKYEHFTHVLKCVPLLYPCPRKEYLQRMSVWNWSLEVELKD